MLWGKVIKQKVQIFITTVLLSELFQTRKTLLRASCVFYPHKGNSRVLRVGEGIVDITRWRENMMFIFEL